MRTRGTAHAESAWNMRLIGSNALSGAGDGMHINVRGKYAYIGHMGHTGYGKTLRPSRIGTSIVDVSDPRKPAVVRQLGTPKGTHTHKVQVMDDLLIINHERNPMELESTDYSAGLAIYDLSTDPTNPTLLSFLPVTGNGRHVGVHRMTYWKPPYVYASASADGFSDQILMIIDIEDPTRPKEAGRFWLDGMNVAGGEIPTWDNDRRYACHHAIVDGERAYCGWWDGGLVIVDISSVAAPSLVSHMQLDRNISGCTHSALPIPERDLLILTDESVKDDCQEVFKHTRVVDISDDTQPKVIATFPVPDGNFCERGGRFGAHNLHEPRPGSFQSSDHIYVTYSNAGVRVVDISNANSPTEIAWYIPECPPGQPASQINDLYVDHDGLVYATDRYNGGLYIIEHIHSRP